jgi:hypothetical protein
MPRLLALVLASLLALATACGSEDEEERSSAEGQSPQAAVAAAGAKTTDVGSYRADFALAMDGAVPGSPGRRVTMTGDGVFDTEKQSGRMTFDMSEFSKALGAPDVGDVEMVMQRFVMYMKFPALQQLQPGSKPWVKFDLRKLAAQQGFDLGAVQQLSNSDPRQALAYLDAVSGKVDEVGEEEVRGAETTRYRMTVDLEKVAERSSAQREDIRRAIEQSGVRELPTEVWVDDEGLVRRMRLTYEDMQFAPGQRGDMELTMELFDFGVEVDVEPPPANQVVDVETLMRADT